jgi:hypothetical protein
VAEAPDGAVVTRPGSIEVPGDKGNVAEGGEGGGAPAKMAERAGLYLVDEVVLRTHT